MDSQISAQLLSNHNIMHITTNQQLLTTDVGGDSNLIKLVFSRRRQPTTSRRNLRRRGKPAVTNISLFELLPELSQVNPHLQNVLQGLESDVSIKGIGIVSPIETTHYVDMNIVSRYSEGEEFEGLSILLEDVTQSYLLNEKVENLETKLKLVQSQLDMATHELGTPLTLISGYAEILYEICEEVGLTPQQMQCLELINKNVDELHVIVNNLFDIVYAESGELQLTTTPVPLGNLLKTVGHELQSRVLAKSQYLELEIEPGLPPVLCDPTRVTQVMKNLIVNACNFSPNGSSIRVLLTTMDEVGYIKFSVEDHGINIPEDEQETIFDQFYRSKYAEQSRSGNAGLGLHIAQILIELHDGEIWCNSNPDGPGSTFHFTLPTADRLSADEWDGAFDQDPLLYNSVRYSNGR